LRAYNLRALSSISIFVQKTRRDSTYAELTNAVKGLNTVPSVVCVQLDPHP
jgi:hypothetical protein